MGLFTGVFDATPQTSHPEVESHHSVRGLWLITSEKAAESAVLHTSLQVSGLAAREEADSCRGTTGCDCRSSLTAESIMGEEHVNSR